jgi:(1->4)-alpha-D-glucan 1-alpha-D-glucosylmutase
MKEADRTDDEKMLEAFEKVSGTLPFRIPISTYRLQFNSGFRFRDAKDVLPYLHSLGISDIYASPYFRANPGSKHGYDITEHGALNPELGTGEDYESFASEIRKNGMGQILDIVPNHMSIASSENALWADVLENGPSSPFARYFDIDWRPVKKQLQDKIIIPILGEQFGRVLEDQGLRVVFDSGGFFIEYYSHRLPLEPKTYTFLLGYRIEELEEELGGESPHMQELLSIITALKNLPPLTEKNAVKVTERLREKEIIKRRLMALQEECPEFRAYLEANVTLFNGSRHDGESFDLLEELLGAQVYRLAYWRVATEEINYRRFFDINDLAAIRMEDPEVFRDTHSLVFRLIGEGMVTGLRVDHPDGLQRPNDYFRRLQRECFVHLCLGRMDPGEKDAELEERIRALYDQRLQEQPGLRMPFYIVGEKILLGAERLPRDWPVFGTTGYVFMNSAGGAFVRTENLKAFDAIYSRFIKAGTNYSETLFRKKKLIMESTMASEINVLAHSLSLISESDRHFRDFTLNSLTDAVVEVIASFPVYRTYVDGPDINDRDRRYMEMAVSKARRKRLDLDPSIFDFIRDVLTLNYPEGSEERTRKQWLEFTMKFQQLTGPVMAKGLEDTVFYTFNRLVSLNEVGGSPERFGTTVEAFHGQNLEKIKDRPHTLNATSTHDSKRCEDVRARISVLSEIPHIWKEHLTRWARMNRRKKTLLHGLPAPDRNEEYLFYQTLLGAWPHGGPMPEEAHGEFTQRISDYMLKAAREAKANTTWINPNAEYEEALIRFVREVLSSKRFLGDFMPLARRVSDMGIFNSLSQTLLKITSPGVPDFYQGTELWNLSLVDPDNRRHVDYPLMSWLIEELKGLERTGGEGELARELLRVREDGRIKLYLTYKALSFRNRHSDLFLNGRYIPIQAEGAGAEHIIAFVRSNSGASVITVVPRLVAGLIGFEETSGGPTGDLWKDTLLVLPEPGNGKAEGRFRNVFTGENIETGGRGKGGEGGKLPLSDVLSSFPVALLEEFSPDIS